MQNKKFYFAVSNPPKCITNLRTQPMHFKMNLEIYQSSFVIKEVLFRHQLKKIQFFNLIEEFTNSINYLQKVNKNNTFD